MGLFSGVKNAVSGVFGGKSGSSFLYNAGLSALETGVNALASGYTARQQWKYDKKLMDYQNQYNLPVNQRARLEEAGYNPNLALNGVNVQSASASAPSVQPTKLDLLQAYNLEAQNKLLLEQQKLTRATMTKNKADAKKSDALTESQDIKNEKAKLDLQFYKDTGVDPDSWQGNAFKPIWNSADKVTNWAIKHLESPENDYFWNMRMQNARREYAKRFLKK